MHNGWLEIGGEKMSKSKGRPYTVPELLEMGYRGPDLRFFLIRQHYRSPLPFTTELLDVVTGSEAVLDMQPMSSPSVDQSAHRVRRRR